MSPSSGSSGDTERLITHLNSISKAFSTLLVSVMMEGYATVSSIAHNLVLFRNDEMIREDDSPGRSLALLALRSTAQRAVDRFRKHYT